ncbi:(d)CMP kinase, partial [Enterococcus faecalis]|uniref:(d)CMP kinase n=1 Tax=Enterococcus faecalis TaxID=1351 RepID=UPI003D6ADA63
MGKNSIVIDEPATSGKSTVAKFLAILLNYVYCDTGVMYRAITYLALQNQIDIQGEEPLVALCVNHTISFLQAE